MREGTPEFAAAHDRLLEPPATEEQPEPEIEVYDDGTIEAVCPYCYARSSVDRIATELTVAQAEILARRRFNRQHDLARCWSVTREDALSRE